MVAFPFSDDEMMTMTITIPEWLMWIAGAPLAFAAVVVLMCFVSSGSLLK